MLAALLGFAARGVTVLEVNMIAATRRQRRAMVLAGNPPPPATDRAANGALKSFRFISTLATGESCAGGSRDLTLVDPAEVPEWQYTGTGPSGRWKEGPMVQWSWRAWLADMDEGRWHEMTGGADVVSFWVRSIPGSICPHPNMIGEQWEFRAELD